MAECGCFAAPGRLLKEVMGQATPPRPKVQIDAGTNKDSHSFPVVSEDGLPRSVPRHGAGHGGGRQGARVGAGTVQEEADNSSGSVSKGRTARGFNKCSTELPPGWEIAVDPNRGCIYYYHRECGISQWEHPGHAKIDLSADDSAADGAGTRTVASKAWPSEDSALENQAASVRSWGCGTQQAPRAARQRLVAARAAVPKASDVKRRLERIPESALRLLDAQRSRVFSFGRNLRTASGGKQEKPGDLTMLPFEDKASSDSGQISDCSSNMGSDRSCTSSASTGLTNGDMSTSSRREKKEEESPKERLVDGVLVKQPEDGSCLFHSIAYGLDDGTQASTLRAQIASCIGEKPTLQIAKTTIEEWVRLTAGTTTATYTKELSDRSTWGGALEMAVAAQIKGINIDVYERCGHQFLRISSFIDASATKTVNVVYRTRPCRHYDALRITPNSAMSP